MLYEVRALQGNVVTSVRVDALNESDARTQVLARALTPISVRIAGHGLRRLGASRSGGLSLLLFSQELLALLEGGLTIVESIDVLTEKESRPAVRTLYARIARGLTEGKSFSTCIEDVPEVFPPLYVGIVRSAEKTSNLGAALARYIEYQSRIDAVRGKIVSASIYPAILILVGLGVIGFLGAYVVPKYLFGRPLDQFATQAWIPWPVRRTVFQFLLRLAVAARQLCEVRLALGRIAQHEPQAQRREREHRRERKQAGAEVGQQPVQRGQARPDSAVQTGLVAGAECLVERLVERARVLDARIDRFLGRDPAPIELAEQLAEAVGEDRHLDFFEGNADHATAVAGLQEERALAGFPDRPGHEALRWIEDVATSRHGSTLYRFAQRANRPTRPPRLRRTRPR